MPIIELTKTPLVAVPGRAAGIYVKDETEQLTGAFKIRGVSAKLLQDAGHGPVCTASTGNHGAAVAQVAKLLRRQAVIFVPSDTPQAKTERIVRSGATLRLFDGDYTSCAAAAEKWALREGATYIPSFDDPDIIRGHMGLFREIIEELDEEPSCVWVPVGGGGLLSASLLSMPSRTRIIGVELEGADALRQSLAAGRRLTIEVPRGVAEGLCVRQVGALPFHIASLARVAVVAVSVGQLEEAVRELWYTAGIRAELAGAAAYAAASSYSSRIQGSHVAVVSGGNIDRALFDQILGTTTAAA
ncbi:pyridoxal-phosphate dependent enzyme [Arthrobacter sp. ISL-85]|uniref:threonine ammonia-lyase n=1 Tax=Arthrobacter sp. ISL-85 TaxID=2819115 RepID=UPI001BE7993E|nr:pyridoxal-phosphate dependent enzyme [Arthrobacter sp. ISL-85]MBT2565110.1 pyridoxal-phosphate dependent enzyme [Arthrobacter sp. ISL-85]